MVGSINPVRVLVVDDTVVYRKIVSDILSETEGVEVVGVAANGKIALQKIEHYRPDIITLDLEMPEMDGLQVLRELRARQSDIAAIMLSAFTSDGAKATIKAMELGAMDFLLKPEGGSIEENRVLLKKDLCDRIKALAKKKNIQNILTGQTSLARKVRETPVRTDPGVISPRKPLSSSQVIQRSIKPRVVVIGISTGGPQSLSRMMPRLPDSLGVPVLVVQHMPPMFTRSLAEDLNNKCALEVGEAVDGEALRSGRVLIAPGGRQMKIIQRGDMVEVCITDDPPENSCRPSVDYLFRSAAHVFGGAVVGVIMTGMGSDGTLGCRLLKRNHATIITQDEASCVVYGMPRQPAEEGLSDIIAPLDSLAHHITSLVQQRTLQCK